MRHLCGQTGRDILNIVLWRAVVYRHLPALASFQPVTKALVHTLVQREPSPHHHAHLSVLQIQHVLRVKASRTAILNPLLTNIHHVEGSQTLHKENTTMMKVCTTIHRDEFILGELIDDTV